MHIVSELALLGHDVAQQTVARYMVRTRKPPSHTWRTFLDNHLTDIAACDFFTIPTVTFRVLYVFIILRHNRRQVVHLNVTANPYARWTAQQIINAFPFQEAPRFLLRDRDGIYGDYFRKSSRWIASSIRTRCVILKRRSDRLVRRYRYARDGENDRSGAVLGFLRDLFQLVASASSGSKREGPKNSRGVPLTVRQAARRLNVDDRTIYSLCSSGWLAHHRIGNGRGTIRIAPDDLSRFLDNSRVAVRASEAVVVDHRFGSGSACSQPCG